MKMGLHAVTDIARNAQLHWDNLEDPRFEQEHLAERARDLAVAYRSDLDKCIAAEQESAGTFSGFHYSEVSLALHKLHHTDPSELIGSGVLEKLYQLAKVEARAIDDQLLEMAQQEVGL